jgi:hypothetical protein
MQKSKLSFEGSKDYQNVELLNFPPKVMPFIW